MTQWIANQFRTFRRIYVWWRDQLTVVGKVVFLTMLGCLPTLADSDAILAIAFMACSVTLLVANATSYMYRPRLAIKVTCPKNWMRTESRVVLLELTNRAHRAVYDLQLTLLPEAGTWEIVESTTFVRVLQPGQTIAIPTTIKALRRGLFELPRLQTITLFPFHLVRRAKIHKLSRQMLILPFYRELRTFQLTQSAPNVARGSNLALQTVGLTGEYVGSREYQPGIPVRKWDYPSWARLGQPVVREFSELRHPSAAIVLDTFFTPQQCKRKETLEELEGILSLAAATSAALIAHGNRIELLAIGDRVFKAQGNVASNDHLAILERLALAQPCCNNGLPQLIQLMENTLGTWELAIVLSHRWESEQEQLFQAVTKQRVLGMRVIVNDNGNGKTNGNGQSDKPLCVTTSQIETGLVDL